ncbi:hypothetical protein E4U59_007697 [Claviceps monticola]|nr:hypothetical protein E4U59_007697 [Claviceps monticola]
MSSLLELVKWSKILENALLDLGLHSSAMHDGNPFPATRPCWTAVREPEYILSPVTCVKVVAHAPYVEEKWKLQKKVLETSRTKTTHFNLAQGAASRIGEAGIHTSGKRPPQGTCFTESCHTGDRSETLGSPHEYIQDDEAAKRGESR